MKKKNYAYNGNLCTRAYKLRKIKKLKVDNLQKSLLLLAAIGLIPVAFSYGLIPEKSMGYLYDISVSEINFTNILRAVMGLYLAMVFFWFIGAFNT